MSSPDDAIAGAMAVTEEFLATFNAENAHGHAATLAYPHIRLASGRVLLWETLGDAVARMELAMPSLREAGWDHSEWNHRNVIHVGADKVHLDVQFTRYRADGSVIGVFPAVYVIVQQEGRWLIQCRSSYAP